MGFKIKINMKLEEKDEIIEYYYISSFLNNYQLLIEDLEN